MNLYEMNSKIFLSVITEFYVFPNRRYHMFFARTKKYLGLLLALSIVFGILIFNPEDVKADSGIELDKVYTVTEDDYRYQLDDYCAAYKFVPSRDLHISGSLRRAAHGLTLHQAVPRLQRCPLRSTAVSSASSISA